MQASAQDSDRNVKVTVEKAPVDCHYTPVVARAPMKICQTKISYTVENTGAEKISADLLCKSSVEAPLSTKLHLEIDPRKTAHGVVVPTRMSAEENTRSSCFLQIGGKQFEIFKDYQPEWK